MTKLIILLVKLISFNRVRGNPSYGLRWWYTPWHWTERCGHGGWICLSWSWLQRHWDEGPRAARAHRDHDRRLARRYQWLQRNLQAVERWPNGNGLVVYDQSGSTWFGTSLDEAVERAINYRGGAS